MADIKISSLDKTETAKAGDYLIINEGDTTTKKIDVSKLVGGNTLMTPYMHDFLVNSSACNTAGAEKHQISGDLQNVTAQYTSWAAAQATAGVGSTAPIKEVGISNPKVITMPPGANAAIIFFEGGVTFNTRDEVTGNIGEHRYIKSNHRIRVSGATFAFDTGTPESFGVAMGGPIELTTNSTTQWGFQGSKEFYAKYSAITFTEGASVTFTSIFNVHKAGRGSITANMGRMVIIPFNDAGGSISQAIAASAGASAYSDMDAEEDGVAWSAAVEAEMEGYGFREKLRRAILALESRKNYKPTNVTPATDAEYDALIHGFWDTLDDTSLKTYEQTMTAFNNLTTEALKPKYGVGNLFEYETQAGASTRRLL